MLEIIENILVHNILGYDQYNGNDLVKDGLVDSLAVLEIISEIEDAFGIEVPGELMKASNFRTCDSIMELVIKCKN